MTRDRDEIVEVIETALKRQQGRARARLVNVDDVVWTVYKALTNGYGAATTGREKVANSYGYSAQASACDVVVGADHVIIAIDRDNCGSTTPLELSQIQWDRWKPETIRERLEEVTMDRVYTASTPEPLVLTLDEAWALTGWRRLDWARDLARTGHEHTLRRWAEQADDPEAALVRMDQLLEALGQTA